MGRRSKKRGAVHKQINTPQGPKSVNDVDLYEQHEIERLYCDGCNMVASELLQGYCSSCWTADYYRQHEHPCQNCSKSAWDSEILCANCKWVQENTVCTRCEKTPVQNKGETCYLCENTGCCVLCLKTRCLALDQICHVCWDRMELIQKMQPLEIKRHAANICVERFRHRKNGGRIPIKRLPIQMEEDF